MRKQLKKKLSIVFRDRDEIPHRKGKKIDKYTQ